MSSAWGSPANGFRDTVPEGDDRVSGSGIIAGPNGICDTEANDSPLAPSNVPTAQAVQNYLNTITWGPQANVFFTVTRSDASVKKVTHVPTNSMYASDAIIRV